MEIVDGLMELAQSSGIASTKLKFIPAIVETTINIPAPSIAGNYTLITLEDVLNLGSLIPTYVGNAAAVTEGLAVNKIYKTPTGELRVVV